MASGAAIKAGEAFVLITADDSKLQIGLRKAQARVRAFAESTERVGRGLLSIAASAAAPLAMSSAIFMRFTDQMSTVRAVTGATERDFARLTQQAEELGRTTSFTASEVAAAMTELARAGFDTEQILSSIAGVLNTARAGGMGLAEAATITTDTLRSFGMEASEAGRVSDVLAKTANMASTDVPMIGQALKYVASAANMSGQSLETVNGALAVLANRGLKADMAGTSLAQVFLQLADSGVQEKLEGMGIAVMDTNGNMRNLLDIMRELGRATESMGNVGRLSLFKDLFDVRGMRAASMLAGNTGEWDQMIAKLETASGTAAKMAAVMDDNVGGAYRRMMSAVEGVAIAVGTQLNPTLISLMDYLTATAGTVTAFVAENGELVRSVADAVLKCAMLGGGLLAVSIVAKGAATAIGLSRTAIELSRTALTLYSATAKATAFMIGVTEKAIVGLGLNANVSAVAVGLKAKALVVMSGAAKLASASVGVCGSALSVFSSRAALSAAVVGAKTKALAALSAMGKIASASLSVCASALSGYSVRAAAATAATVVKTKALAALAAAGKAASAAIAPITLALIAAVVAYSIAIKAVDAYVTSLGKTSDTAQKALETERELHREDKLRLERLQQLAEKTRLNSQEQAEAVQLAGSLTSRYGDLGITIDSTTGKIDGMAAAQEKLNEKMKQGQVQAMKAAIAEHKSNIDKMQRELDARADAGSVFGLNSYFLWSNDPKENLRKMQDVSGDMAVERQKMLTLMNQLDSLNSDGRIAAPDTADSIQERIENEKAAAISTASEIKEMERRLASFREDAARRHRDDLENEIHDIKREGTAYEEILQKLRDTATARGEAAKAAEYELEIAQAREETERRIAKVKEDAAAKAREEADKERERERERADRKWDAAERTWAEQSQHLERLDAVFSDAEAAEAKRRQDEEIDRVLKEDKGAGLDFLSQLIKESMIRAAQAREQTEARIAEAGEDGVISEEERKEINRGLDATQEARSRQAELEAKARAVMESVASVPALEIRGTSAAFGTAAGLAVGSQTSDQRRAEEIAKATKDTAEYSRKTFEALRDGGMSGTYQ